MPALLSQSRQILGWLGHPSLGTMGVGIPYAMGIKLASGANALETADAIRAKLDQIER